MPKRARTTTARKEAPKNIVGTKVHELRESRGWGQQEFAEMLRKRGVHADRFTVLKIEQASRTVTDIELVTLSEIFGVSPMSLLK
jgi:DNA-binding transcriptional regulator YiaG